VVTYVGPDGDFRIAVPSGSCRSRHPQNVFTKWCYRFAKIPF
jgi:hypothetical protein